MTNESLHKLIVAYNRRQLPRRSTLHSLSNAVVFGWVAPRKHANRVWSKLYFILAGDQCVGVVHHLNADNPLGVEDLHWYVLPNRRKQGHLYRSLSDTVLPHLFGDGRDSLTVSVDTPDSKAYAIRQGFVQTNTEKEVRIRRDRVGPLIVNRIAFSEAQLKNLAKNIQAARDSLDYLHHALAVYLGENHDDSRECATFEACLGTLAHRLTIHSRDSGWPSSQHG